MDKFAILKLHYRPHSSQFTNQSIFYSNFIKKYLKWTKTFEICDKNITQNFRGFLLRYQKFPNHKNHAKFQ